MALDKVAYIQNKIKAMIGDAVVAACDEELAAITNSISFANVRYWKTFPYQFRELFTVTVSDQSVRQVSITALKEAAFSNVDTRGNAYYLGVLRIDQNNKFDLPQFSGIDSLLLGKPVAYGGSSSQPDLDKLLLDKTNNEILTGDIDFEHDQVNDLVKYVLPFTEGSAAVVHGFGFEDPDLAFLKHNHLEVFAKIASFEFLETIISARSAINLQGDFNLDLEFLKEKHTELKESLNKDLDDMSITPIIFS